MKKLTLVFTLCVAFVLSITSTAKNDAQGEKITICHIPPGNPDNAHAITVSINAMEAHLAHGDSIGDCGGDDQ